MKDLEKRRWLAEAGRYAADFQITPAEGEDADAVLKARAAAGGLEDKIISYARALPQAQALLDERRLIARWSKFAALFALILSFFLGAFAASAAFDVKQGLYVNIFWLLIILLGVHLLSLAFWLFSALLGKGGVLGRFIFHSAFWVLKKLKTTPERTAGVRATLSRDLRAGVGYWRTSALSHGLWASYLLGAVLALFLLLATQRYEFVWETTILTADAYLRITEIMAALPEFFGLVMPAADLVQNSEWPLKGDLNPVDRGIWANFLFAVIVLYGVVPRVVLVSVSMVFSRRHVQRNGLDLRRPYYARLIAKLSPVVENIAVVDPDEDGKPRLNSKLQLGNIPAATSAGVRVLGWELDDPPPAWPKDVEAVEDLGFYESQRKLADLLAQRHHGKPLVLVFSLAQSPDRSIQHVLNMAVASEGAKNIFVVLSHLAKARQDLGAEDARLRLGDWVAAAHAGNVLEGHIVVLDLYDAQSRTTPAYSTLFGTVS